MKPCRIIERAFVFCLVLSGLLFSNAKIKLDPIISEPRYESISSNQRGIPSLTIFLYYEVYPNEPVYFATSSYKEGNFWPYLIDVPIQNVKFTNFQAIYYLKNSHVQINGHTYFAEETIDNTDIANKYKIIDLYYDSLNNTLKFPVITKESNSALHLALHAYYVLTHYLESAPIQPYSSSDGQSIPVNVITEYGKKTIDGDVVSRCHYNPDRKDINVSTKWDCSYYDSTYKHEYGHHLTHSVFKIPYTKYNPKYKLFEHCDEQTALNEGFSVFLSSRGTFNGLNDDFHNYIGINAGNDGANLYEKYKSDVRSSLITRSGESVIGNISIALMQIDPTKNMKTKNFENLL